MTDLLTLDTSRWLKIVFIFLLAAILSLAAIYLAGFFVLMSFKTNPTQADFLTYYTYLKNYHTHPLYQKRLYLSAIFACCMAYGIPLSVYMRSLRAEKSLHGAARFATTRDIAKSGLLNAEGIIVGKWKHRYLMFAGQQFVLLAAPTRSGKGVGIVIPNLLNYPDSMVVLDIKQENFNLTAGFRQKHGQQVFLFNPFAEDLRTARYNPLGYVREGLFRVGDLIAIAEVFYPSDTHHKDAFFNDQARNLFMGLGLYLCETAELPCTIGEMLRQSSGDGQPAKRYWEKIIAARAKSDRPLSKTCVEALSRFINTHDQTFASILASFNAPLGMWANPIVDAATSFNDFDLRLVRKQRMTIYIGVTPDHLSEAGRLINLLFSQLINLNVKESPQNNPDLKYPCLLLMDEFTAIGKLNIAAKAIGYMAGYNLRFLPIIQSVSQLVSVYGAEDARTFITNHALQIFYAPREQKDANDYSEMLGYETVKSKSKSRKIGVIMGGRNESESDQKRALLLPQEIKEIGASKEIISLENMKPILCEKIRYFSDPVFSSRILPPPVVPILNMNRHQAIVEKKSREMTLEDIAHGVDLKKLTLDMSQLEAIDGAQVKPEDVDEIVRIFFEALQCRGEGVTK